MHKRKQGHGKKKSERFKICIGESYTILTVRRKTRCREEIALTIVDKGGTLTGRNCGKEIDGGGIKTKLFQKGKAKSEVAMRDYVIGGGRTAGQHTNDPK